jgi:hypothetical protein
VASTDNLPFMIVDKVNARVFLFDGQGRIKHNVRVAQACRRRRSDARHRAAPVVNRPEGEPRGRFVPSLDHRHPAKEIRVDYDTALSHHAVVKGTARNAAQSWLAASASARKPNTISYGCINVPVPFCRHLVSLQSANGIVYICRKPVRLRKFSAL